MRQLILILVLTLVPVNSWAEEACGPQDYDSEEQPRFDCPGPGENDLRMDLGAPASIPVRQGTELVSEWDGALVHRDRLLEIGANMRIIRRLRWLDRLRLREEFEVEMAYHRRIFEARLEFIESQRDTYRDRAVAAEQRVQSAHAWWRSPALWFAIGIITAGALVALTAYGLSAVD